MTPSPIVFKVFISSRDALKDERATAEKAVDDLSFIPILGDSWHQLPSSQREHWLKLVEAFDLAILIVDKEDSDYVKDEIIACFRSGTKVLMLRKAEEERDKELEDFIRFMEEHVFISNFKTCVDLRDKIQKGILYELTRKYRESPQIIEGKVQSFEYVSQLFSRTKDRLFLVTRTLPIITSTKKDGYYDVEFCRAIENWINKRVLNNSGIFYCFYCVEQTKKEIKEYNLDGNVIIRNLEKYKKLEETTNGKFRVSSIRNFNNPMVIGDEEFCLWMFLHPRGRDGMGIACRCKKTAGQLISYMERHFVNYDKSLTELINELEI